MLKKKYIIDTFITRKQKILTKVAQGSSLALNKTDEPETKIEY